jgi:hypothetical protein
MVIWRKWRSLSPLRFFTLTSKEASLYRNNIFTQIHEIVFHGNGGYDWLTIYNMPIWLRKFTFHKLKTHYEEQSNQNDSVEESIKNMRNAGASAPKKQAVPDYVTKAVKK